LLEDLVEALHLAGNLLDGPLLVLEKETGVAVNAVYPLGDEVLKTGETFHDVRFSLFKLLNSSILILLR
jgi:hypothetical protein